ncbi:MAG: hypothetical protein Q9187_002681 [Circinaria calcarea]
MKPFLFTLLAASVTNAQYVLKSMSFGHEKGQVLWQQRVARFRRGPYTSTDKVILTPPYPGNQRGALWTDARVPHSEWTADFEFRAGGPEHGGGNLQVWYTREGLAEIGASSVYTVGKFDGMVLVIDMHGGRGGGIRAFLNDGSTDYKNHHHVDSLAFGHCDYSYRNLGRPSRIRIIQDSNGFEVIADDKRCFRSDQVKLPSENYFGITAASSDTPDSFEIFKFVLKTSNSYAREEPRRQTKPPPVQNQDQGSQQQANQPITHEQVKDAAASSIKTQDTQLADVNNRLQTMSHSMDNLFREVTKLAGLAQERHNEVQQKVQQTASQLNAVEDRLRKIEDALVNIRKEISSKDYSRQFSEIHKSLEARHANLLERLPDTMGHIISTRSPRVGFFVFLLVIFQLLLAGAYVTYKRRRANAPKKYL